MDNWFKFVKVKLSYNVLECHNTLNGAKLLAAQYCTIVSFPLLYVKMTLHVFEQNFAKLTAFQFVELDLGQMHSLPRIPWAPHGILGREWF